ncbi:Thiamine pyrophosphokinase [Hypsizygus marmoreus]|uniref:Thiamine pyrophosphokinase n=1 Tax=Hypsizygus marmoreus TaxID=39966 RepID=A0A369JUE0_HYPMA|nr:Thiamine pyrophosphokinase [Hypsizygus marmoreus]
MLATLFRSSLNWSPTSIATKTQGTLYARLYHRQHRPDPLHLPAGHRSLLPLVLSSSNLVLQASGSIVGTRMEDGTASKQEPVVPFFLSVPTSEQRPTGFLRQEVLKAIQGDHGNHKSEGKNSPWHLQYSPAGDILSISFAEWVNKGGKYARTMHMERLVQEWRHKQIFPDILRGWSNEAYPVYHHAPVESDTKYGGNPVAFAIERAALPLFGFANFGCLLTAYFRSPETGKTMLWIPRRSITKRTWPGKLDVTVGGGISLGDTALSTIVRECAEEALLDTTYVHDNVRPVGVLPFPNRSPTGWILPGLYYLYDLLLPADGSIVPRTNVADGEVESFELMGAETVLQNLLEGRFKASSALAIVDFLIRHGLITEASDSRYVDVCRLLKGDFTLPVPWQ